MRATVPSRITVDEFLARPETKPASEYACGESWKKPMPSMTHGRLQLYVAMLIAQFLLSNPIGVVVAELRCVFGPAGRERAYVPDVSFATFDRYPHNDTRKEMFLQSAPDLAVEILSPRQHAGRFAAKIQAYLRYGTRMVWVIDPYRESVAVYTPAHDEQVLRAGDTLDGGDVLPGFSVPVAEIFAQIYV